MIKTRKGGRKSLIPPKDYFESIYYNENVSIDEMAKLWGVNKQTIYNWAHKYRHESNNLDSNTQVSDKQILNCPTTINYNKKKERSKIS